MDRKLAEQYFQRADEFVRAGKPDEALPLIGMLAEAYPDDKNVMLARARTLAAMGRGKEAAAVCDALIARFDSARAKALKAAIGEDGERALPVTRKPPRWRRAATLVAIVLTGAGAIAYAAWYVEREERANSSFAAPNSGAYAALLRERDAARREREGQEREAMLARAHAPVTEPMTRHPREEWTLAAKDGVPDYKAGIYEEVPCINEPERTIDVFLPMAYQERPEALFPATVIQMPMPNPSFLKLVPWAESREVILVVINSSSNATFDTNHIAQDRALETVAATLRVDQRLGFAIGMSGGGRSSWKMVCRYPDNFRGVVMMGISGHYDCTLPPGVRVTYIHGDREPNNPHIAKAIPLLRSRGHEVKEIVVPGEHVMGPPSARIEMIDWMVRESRREYGLEHPEHDVPELAEVMQIER